MGAVILGQTKATGVQNYVELANGWVAKALSEGAVLDGGVTFAVSVMLLPTEQGPQPAWGIMVGVPSPFLGQQPISNMALLPGPNPPQAAFEQSAKQALGTVMKQRSDVLGLGVQH
jgi:hypothetical protein